MPVLDEQELKIQLKQEKFSPLYFIYGEDNYLKQVYAQQISKKCVNDKLPELNYAKIDGKNLKLQTLADEVDQLPVMCEYRCIVVSDYDIGSKGENEVKDFKTVISNIPESTVLILLFETTEINQKKGKWVSIIKSASKYGSVLECKYKRDSDIVKYISVWSNKEGVRIDNTVARYIIENCGRDLQRLKGEVLKLCAFKKDSFVSKEDVDRITSKTAEATQYMLPKAVMSMNISSSLNVISDLLDMRMKPTVILNSVIENFIDIYRVKAAISEGKRPTDIASDFGYTKNREFVLRNAEPMAKRISYSTLRKCMDILSDADKTLKSSSIDTRLVLEKTIIQVIETLRGTL